MPLPTPASCALLLSLAICAGCEVQHNSGPSGQDSVKIATPFGGMNVKGGQDAIDTGLAVYPGAVTDPDNDDGKSNGNADVGLSFGGFHLKIQVAPYRTADPEDKVLAFYRNDLKKYGDVLECVNGKPTGAISSTSGGLTCSDKGKGASINTGDDGHNHELRAGQPHHFHMMAIDEKKSRAGETSFVLMNLELPKGSDTD